jgi:hypothetical protein
MKRPPHPPNETHQEMTLRLKKEHRAIAFDRCRRILDGLTPFGAHEVAKQLYDRYCVK